MPPEELPLLDLFTQLRECGLPLGIGEYQLVLKAWQAGYGTKNRAALERLCRTVWVKSPEDAQVFEVQFNRLIQQLPEQIAAVAPQASSRRKWFNFKAASLATLGISTLAIAAALMTLRQDIRTGLGRMPLQINTQSDVLYKAANQLVTDNQTDSPDNNLETQLPVGSLPNLSNIPALMVVQPEPIPWWQQHGLAIWIVLWLLSGAIWGWSQFKSSQNQRQRSKAPSGLTLALTQQIRDEVQIARLNQPLPTGDYLPVTQRQMKQSWRYLRRMVRSGPPIELDIEATIDDIGRQGMLLTPVFRPRRVNRAEVLLLIDQDGSMAPFHGLSQRLVETALQGGQSTQARIYYFHNSPAQVLFHDPYCQSADAVDQVIQSINSDYAGLFIVSDAGAAYGRWNPGRLALTERFLQQMSYRVRYLAWLNPMPQDRWSGTTAEAIANRVPMFEFNRAGLDQAIAVLKGQGGGYP
ncbi:VWA domain-containing protein [Nodosilinea sp. P-1105]|uniref:VWA domain-containing protein n=1 Tax=Nodosilinea sp. P-1105 TaxID=2546229 RepID=UPI001469F995|nr:VWA domain-containing protein [Nodosilinea sp. P-1105]NMF84862.1 VWA domain-containing protein [Nodosilinea sp. P-1105]